MRTHRVIIQPTALADLNELAKRLTAESEAAGAAWYDRMIDHIFTLESFPSRCPIADVESEKWGLEVRCLLFGDRPHVRRVLYTIVDSTVQILHVTHGARDR